MRRHPRPCLGHNGHRCASLTKHPSGRCDDCRHVADRARGTTAQRGYDSKHKRTREEWAPLIATGWVRCARCGKLIAPDEPWDLGHDDADRSRYSGPEHADGNRGRRTCRPRTPTG